MGLHWGGLSVGESPEEMAEVLEAIVPLMPANRPRYLMGVGRPEDLVTAIGFGVDMFDCVMPTRNARNGQLFTRRGPVVISNARYRDDEGPPRSRMCLRNVPSLQPRLSAAPLPMQRNPL